MKYTQHSSTEVVGERRLSLASLKRTNNTGNNTKGSVIKFVLWGNSAHYTIRLEYTQHGRWGVRGGQLMYRMQCLGGREAA